MTTIKVEDENFKQFDVGDNEHNSLTTSIRQICNNQKRRLSCPSGQKKKRKRSAISSIPETVTTDTENVDELWKCLLVSLKEYTKAEVKMFNSDENENTVNDDLYSYLSYSKFLCQLVDKFTKLRRFPKLIAKLLCCLRGHFVSPKYLSKNESMEKKAMPTTNLLLTNEFIDITRSVIASLPGGQIIDLWKTLNHNLKEECINVFQGMSGHSGFKLFMLVVVELFCHLLENVKVVDHAVQTSIIEKVSELMTSLSSGCLEKFGSDILGSVDDQDLVEAFLKLAYTWGELQGLQLIYNNQRYKGKTLILPSDSSPMNLCYLHTYLTPETWLELENKVINFGVSPCALLVVKLVEQKMKFMLTLEKRFTGCDDENICLQENLSAAAKFIWSKQEICGSTIDIYKLTSDFLDDLEIIELARHFLINIQNDGADKRKKSLPEDFQLHYAIVLEVIVQIMNRLVKIKCFKKVLTKVASVILNFENRSYLFKQNAQNKNVFKLLLNAVNELIASDVSEVEECEVDFSCDLVIPHILLLSQLNLEDYPPEVRIVLSMCSLLILIPLTRTVPHDNDTILNMICSIVYQCSQKTHGNEFLFSVQWVNLFKWFRNHMITFSVQAQRQIVLIILQNIYVSPKSVAEFEIELNTLCENFQFSKPNSKVGLIILEYLVTELKTAIRTKSKILPKIQNHIRMLTQHVVESLKRNTKEALKVEISSRAIFFRSCWLLRLVMTNQAATKKSTMLEPIVILNFETLTDIFGLHVKSALDVLLPARTPNHQCVDEEGLKYSRMYALILLHSLCKSREEISDILPEEFIISLWDITVCITTDDWKFLESLVPVEKIHLLPTVICENATSTEFEKILNSLKNEVVNQADTMGMDTLKRGRTAGLLNIIIDAKLTPEKKTLRTKFLEDFLFSSLLFNLQWDYSDQCLTQVVLPHLKFQVKILSRKNPICSLVALAICLTSVTSTPLNGIKDVGVYRKVFCAVADLMNAFTLHRLDVISFRTHIYLQCFQFLMESLVARSDQKNKLSDEEVIDLRYCAHALERICQSTKSGRKEFARIAPYFVAIMMRQFEMFTVYPAVKDPLLSGSYKLLNLCDRHGVAQMNSMLTIGSREIFTRVYELYNKFYRYKGKV